METLRRIAGLVFRPAREWDRIVVEDTPVSVLILRYIVPLCLLGPIATTIGMRYFDTAWDPQHGYRVAAADIFPAAVATLFTSIFSVFLIAATFVLVAPMYGSTRDYRKALTVASYGATPVFLAGAALVLPELIIVTVVAFLQTLYLYWLGAKQMLGVVRNEQAEFVGVSMLIYSVAATLIGSIASGMGAF